VEPLFGKSGWLTLSRLSVEALDQPEDHLILAGMTDLGAALDEQVVEYCFVRDSPIKSEFDIIPGTNDHRCLR
jgi:adenine-specific DNA-methyltransferase